MKHHWLYASFIGSIVPILQFNGFCISEITILRLVQLLKAKEPILARVDGKWTEDKDLQSSNARYPIILTPSGMSIEAKDEHRMNAPRPIESTLFGMLIEDNDLQSENVLNHIIFILLGSETDVSDSHALKSPLRYFTPFGIFIDFNDLHPIKVPPPNTKGLSRPRSTVIICSQSAKAP